MKCPLVRRTQQILWLLVSDFCKKCSINCDILYTVLYSQCVLDVVVTATYATPLYVGSSLTLTCTVTLDPNMDNNETVTTTWSGPSNITGERYLVSATSGSGSTHTSNLTIRYLAVQDDGTYTCTGIVTGEYEQQVTASDSHTIPTIRML